jgi:hypothetical protein
LCRTGSACREAPASPTKFATALRSTILALVALVASCVCGVTGPGTAFLQEPFALEDLLQRVRALLDPA